MEFVFKVAKLVIWARNCSCLDILTLCCMNWTCRTHKKITDNFVKTRWDGPSEFLLHKSNYRMFCRMQRMTDKLPIQAGQSFKFPASLKILTDTMGLQAEDGYTNITEEIWVTIQGIRCLFYFQNLEVGQNALPIYLYNNISFWCL